MHRFRRQLPGNPDERTCAVPSITRRARRSGERQELQTIPKDNQSSPRYAFRTISFWSNAGAESASTILPVWIT
jgi:hypothetical protein